MTSSKTAKQSKQYEPTVAHLEPSYRRILAAVQGEQLLALKGQISAHDYWVHKLLRRSFSFGEVTGEIEVVDIRCTRANKQYDSFTEDSIWHIPESWGDCGVYVKGAEGTTFEFYEYSPAAARSLSTPAVSNE